MSERVSYDELGNMLIDGLKLSVKANSYKVSESFKSAIKDIELQFKNAAISEAEYYKSIERLRDDYLEKGTKEWWSYTNKLITYENKLIDAQQKALEDEMESITKLYAQMAEKIYKTQAEVLKEQEKFQEKLTGKKELYTTTTKVFKGLGENGEDLVEYDISLADLEKEKELLREYYKLLLAVKERGEQQFGKEGFQSFFEVLRDMSLEEGSILSRQLLEQNDEGFNDYIGDWKEIEALGKAISERVYVDDTRAAIDESMDYMRRALDEYGMEVPDGFFASGSLSAEKFGEGFVASIDGVMADISARFEELMPDKVMKAALERNETNKVFSPVYNLYGSGETIAQKLRTAQMQALVEKLRGGY